MYGVGRQQADEDADDCIGELLDQAMDLTVRFLSDRADLSASAAFALNRVSREGPIRLTTLAAKEAVSQPSMTQLIQRLERLGLVTRLADPDDGRAALIGMTGDGQALLDDRKRLRRDRLTALLATLTPRRSPRCGCCPGRTSGSPSTCRECRWSGRSDSGGADDSRSPRERCSGEGSSGGAAR